MRTSWYEAGKYESVSSTGQSQKHHPALSHTEGPAALHHPGFLSNSAGTACIAGFSITVPQKLQSPFSQPSISLIAALHKHLLFHQLLQRKPLFFPHHCPQDTTSPSNPWPLGLFSPSPCVLRPSKQENCERTLGIQGTK